jgi:hypothetical protein
MKAEYLPMIGISFGVGVAGMGLGILIIQKQKAFFLASKRTYSGRERVRDSGATGRSAIRIFT